MSYSGLGERVSPTHSTTASQKSSSSHYVKPTGERWGWKNKNETWRVKNNHGSQTYLGPRYEHVPASGPRYDRMCPQCLKLGHSPDHCFSREPLAGVSFYLKACYFSAETVWQLASLDFDTRWEEIKCMYNVLTRNQVSVISLAMEMYESDESRRARCFRCRAFHSSRLCRYLGRECSLCGYEGHAEVVCKMMSLSRNNCQYHFRNTRFSSNQGQISMLPQGVAFPYAPQMDFYNGKVANVMEQLDLPTSLDDTVDATNAAESNWDSFNPVDTCGATPDPVDTSWAGPDPVDTSWAGPDPVDTSWACPDPVDTSLAGPDPVDTSYAGPEPVDTSWAGPDSIDSSCDVLDPVNTGCNVPDLVDPNFIVPDPVYSGCTAPNPGNESCEVAAPTDPNFDSSTSLNHTARDLSNCNAEEIFTSVPTVAVEKPKYQNENSVGPVKSNLANLNISSCEPAISADFSTSEPLCFEPVDGQDVPKLNQSTTALQGSSLGKQINCSIDSPTSSSSILVSSPVPEENHLLPRAAESCDPEKRSRAKGSTDSASSGSSSDDAYTTAEENILSSEPSDSEMKPSDTTTSAYEAGSKKNDSDGQKPIDASPRIIRDRNSVPKVKPSVYSSEYDRNGLVDQGSPTEHHKSGLVLSIHRVVSKNPVFSSKKNKKLEFPVTTVLQPCYRCLSKKHLPENCRAQDETCHICLCTGHLARACSKPKPPFSRTHKNGSPDQGSPTEQHQLELVPSPHVTDIVDETGTFNPANCVVSKNQILSSKKNRKGKFPLTTVLPPCYRCLSTKHLPENCKAQKGTCFRCNRIGHIAKTCSESKSLSSRTPTNKFSSEKSRVRVRESVREKEAASRSSSNSDSALPPSPVLPAPTRDLPSPAATSPMSPSEKILSDTFPVDGSTGVNSQNWRHSAKDASRLTNNTLACSGNNGFKTQEPDEDDEKVPVNGPTSQRKMMAGDVRPKQRRDDQHRHDRSKHQHYSSRSSPKKQNGKHSDLVAAASAAAVAATGSSARQEPRGTPLASLNRMSAAHPGVPGVNPSRQHEVLVQLPAPQGRPPIPYPPPTAADDMWDQNHVRMPCSPSSLYARDSLPPGYPGTSSRDTVPRWCVIKWALSQPLKSVDDVQRAIVSYNSRYKDKWLLHGLQAVVQQFSEEEEDQFFSRTLPAMCNLALRLPELVTRAPSLLVAHRCKAVTLSQLQIASLLANAFFCTFPRRNARGSDTEYALFPDINFSRLLCADGPTVLEKIKCLLNYFRVVTTSEPVGLVTFARHMVENAPAVVWQQCTSALPRLHCDDGGLIEEATGLLQVDFANRFLGGGVLGHGCVQEEIRFMLCPELLITRLLAEALDKNEAIIVVGVEQYSRGEGYADSFVFAGCHRDTTPRDHFGRRMCQLTAIDAVHFRARPSEQFKEALVVREINKAYAGFRALEGTAGGLPAVATGNWGCGAFRGNPNLKALLQLAACGYAGRDVAYFTFLDAKLKNRIADMHEFLVKGKITVGALVQCICQYGALSREVDGSDLYQYLYHNLRDPSRTPSPGDSPRPADQGPQQTENTSERTSGSSWAAKSREMNGNGFDGPNGKNGAQNKARGKETVANNARMTDFFPRLSEKGQRENNKNGTDSLTGTGNGSIASVPQPSSFPPCLPSQSTGGFWDDSSPVQQAPARGNGDRGSRHKRNRRRKEGLTHQQIVDVITGPDTTEEENGDVREEGNGSGAGEEFTSSAAKRFRKKKTKGNRRNAHNVKDGNALKSEVGVNKIATGLSKKITSHDDQRFTSSKKSVGCS